MKDKISYILTAVIALSTGIFGTYLFMDKYHKQIIIRETERTVSVTENDTIQSSISKIYDATILVKEKMVADYFYIKRKNEK